jgi:hypothetical protein
MPIYVFGIVRVGINLYVWDSAFRVCEVTGPSKMTPAPVSSGLLPQSVVCFILGMMIALRRVTSSTAIPSYKCRGTDKLQVPRQLQVTSATAITSYRCHGNYKLVVL